MIYFLNFLLKGVILFADMKSRPEIFSEGPKKRINRTRPTTSSETQGYTSLSTKGSQKWLFLLPLQTSMCYPSSMSTLTPGYTPWDDTSQLISPSSGIMTSHDEYDLHGIEADSGSRGALKISNISSSGGVGSSSREIPSSELSKQTEPASVLHGIPDFSEVYSFIGSVFDPESKGHVQKLKEMDPINFETVVLLMRNLTVNLSSPDFEPMKKVLSSYDTDSKTLGVSTDSVYERPKQ
ncbi:hypothetical protein HanPI659440_Chr14g0565241 [Helianthus annuus]|nr:hypothetical protein HanPI659440_Chr14g0565241 [Helianthus annuus]